MFRLEDLPEIDSELAERLKSTGLDHPLLLAVADDQEDFHAGVEHRLAMGAREDVFHHPTSWL